MGSVLFIRHRKIRTFNFEGRRENNSSLRNRSLLTDFFLRFSPLFGQVKVGDPKFLLGSHLLNSALFVRTHREEIAS